MPSPDRTSPNLAAGLVAIILLAVAASILGGIGFYFLELAQSVEVESSC